MEVESIVDLYEAGYRNLPTAAAQYEQVVAELGTPLPATLGRLYFRTRSKFQIARSRLLATANDVRWFLASSGEALVQVAGGYEATDEEIAEAMRQIGHQVTDEEVAEAVRQIDKLPAPPLVTPAEWPDGAFG